MTKEKIFNKGKALTKKLKRIPSTTDLAMAGLSRATIRHHFYSITLFQKMLGKVSGIKKQPSSLEQLLQEVANG